MGENTFTDEQYQHWLTTLSAEESETVQMFGLFLKPYYQRKLISRIRILKAEENIKARRDVADMFYYDIHHSCLDAMQVGDIINGKPDIL